MEDTDELVTAVIGAAIEVHRAFGAGFKESTYHKSMMVELGLRGIEFESEVPVVLKYKDKPVGEGRIDLLIKNCLVVELKAAESAPSKYRRQVVAYLKATGHTLGLVINFEVELLKDGVSRVSNSQKEQ
ncbi:MAG: GxxExxY protein [Planctomycetota bacterium]